MEAMTHMVIKKLPVYNIVLFFTVNQYSIRIKANKMNRSILAPLKDQHVTN